MSQEDIKEEKKEEKAEERASEEQIAETQTESEVEIEEPKLEGLARIPNRDKGSSHKPPFVMMGILVVLFILSLVLAKVG